ncbi:armadillo-type protein [Syncephalis pseudoplumigaleata]|uniref:Armadillo-type protein n=1 Tax=Syncephalis pseudoplumigaleata TaxID=1712513 RepID=A0A4V1J1X0_9FUNG|nr:armadillo-type protein [Syncephalis pseudoplumigaleata]|eukprot:RKP26529.1 armadillo-type protein [Syncephalis pseudoplumigaleata]
MDPSANARDRLLYALQEIASQDPARLQAAEDLLREWASETGYFSTLQDIFLNKALDQQIRWQAVIQLKNGIGRYWRRSAKNALQREEKAMIRGRLFENIDEEVPQLAIQNAVIVSKIARCDFPMEWDNLLQTLLSMIQSACNLADPSRARLIKQRALYTLHLVVKSLCSKTLTASRKAFQEISPELFYHVGQIYHMHVEQWMNAIKQQQPYAAMADDMQVSLVALKCLRRLIAHGFEDFTQAETPLHVILVGKLYLDTQYYRPLPFVLAPKSMAVMHTYWQIIVAQGQQRILGQPIASPVVERCLIQGMSLLRALIKNTMYTPQKGAKTFQETSEARTILDQQLLTPEFASSCLETVVGQFLSLSSTDMAAWEDDPEGWLSEEAADPYEFKLRKCAEKLFMDMITQFRELLAPFVVSMLEKVSDRTDPPGLLLKDAVYCAVGLGAHDLYEGLNFEEWLQHRLYAELDSLDPGQPLLRRRIAWLIGEWISVKVSKSARPAIYRLIIALMRPEEAMVVRLTAAESLRQYILYWEFDPVDFSPHLEEAVNSLAQILRDVDEAETRMRILNCLSIIVERMEHEVGCRHRCLLSDSVPLHALVLPLVRLCVDPNTPEFVYLGEEALDLWWVTVQNTPQLTSEMVEVLPMAMALLEHGSDSFVIALRIVESYLLLDAEYLLTQHGEQLLATMTNLLDGVRVRAVRGMLQLVERITEKAPATLYGPIMISTGLLQTMIRVTLETEVRSMVHHHCM